MFQHTCVDLHSVGRLNMSTGLAGNLIVGSGLFGPDTVSLLVCVCVSHYLR